MLPRHGGLRGAGSLPIVMLLLLGSFFLMLYGNRAVIRELRSAALLTRSAAAREAAEAGLAWAQVRINDARPIGADCQPTGADPQAATSASWRALLDSSGSGTVRTAACLKQGSNAWSCGCGGTSGNSMVPPGDDEAHPAFVVRLQAGTRPGSWWIRSTGCAHPSAACLPVSDHDASAALQQLVTPWPLGAIVPAAALTALGAVALSGGVTVVNDDPATRGLTVSAAGGWTLDPSSRLVSLPGRAPADSLRAPDARWLIPDGSAAIPATTFFYGWFGLPEPDLRELPGIVRITCPATGCTSSQLAGALQDGARWVALDGPLLIDAALTGGSPERPVILSARSVTVRAAFAWTGWLHADALDWSTTASGQLRGAATVAGDVLLSGPQVIRFDPAVLGRSRVGSAPLLPVPGTWRDLADEAS